MYGNLEDQPYAYTSVIDHNTFSSAGSWISGTTWSTKYFLNNSVLQVLLLLGKCHLPYLRGFVWTIIDMITKAVTSLPHLFCVASTLWSAGRSPSNWDWESSFQANLGLDTCRHARDTQPLKRWFFDLNVIKSFLLVRFGTISTPVST